jgi:hypothetical protein
MERRIGSKTRSLAHDSMQCKISDKQVRKETLRLEGDCPDRVSDRHEHNLDISVPKIAHRLGVSPAKNVKICTCVRPLHLTARRYFLWISYHGSQKRLIASS